MDGKMAFSPIFFLFNLLLLIFLVKVSEGLRIELIHPFSPESPFYKPNITYSEMMEKFLSRPKIHRTINSNSNIPEMKVIRPVLEHSELVYHAKLNFGTFQDEQQSYKTYYLLFDTGGELLWLECEDCTKPGGHCFRDPSLAYPNGKSNTYNPLLYYHHPLCVRNVYIGQHCSYRQIYEDGSDTTGILAYETLTFNSFHTHPTEAIRIVIGCGIHNKISSGIAKEAGVMGMGWSTHSFISQINTHSQGRFSYCLPPLIPGRVSGRSAILNFGTDTPTIHGLHSLTIHRYRYEITYYVKLQGISISNKRLDIPPKYFLKIGENKGGCIFDTGTTHTYIARKAYRILKEKMINHLSEAYESLTVRRNMGELDLCFERQPPLKGYNHLPTITFHFKQGVNFVMQREAAFLIIRKTDREIICMTITAAGLDDVSVIGAHGQANHVFVYDLPARKMYFGPQDCAQNP